MTENRLEDREIDLIKLLQKALIQWRFIAILAVIFALLIPCCMGLKQTLSGSEQIAVVLETKSDRDMEMEYNSLQYALSTYMQYRTLESAYNNSILNNADFSTATGVKSTYEIKISDDSQRIVTISKAYEAISSDSDFTDAIASVYTKKAAASSIYDICTIDVYTNETEANKDTAVIQVSTILPNGISKDTWSEALTTAVKAYGKSIEKKVGEHKVKLVSVNAVETTANSISTTLNDRITEITSARNAYNSAYTALTVDGKAIVDEIIEKKGEKDFVVFNLAAVQKDLDKAWTKVNTPVDNTPVETPAKNISSAFSAKWIVVGAFLGIVIYFFILLVPEILGKKVTTDEQLELIFSTRHFGSVYRYPYTTSFGRLINSKKLYSIFHKTVSIDKITTDLATKLSFDEIKDVTIITLAHSTEGLAALVAEEKDILQKKGISSSELFVGESVADLSDEQYVGMKNVFVQVVSKKTTYSDAMNLVRSLSQYKINVVGIDFIEVSL